MKKISTIQKISLIVCGLFFCAVLLEVGMRIAGGIYLSLQEYRNRISIKQKATYRIMCLGESTTACGGEDSYSRQLEEILNQRDIGIKFTVINKGVPGITTGAIMSVLEDNLDKYTPDMVIAMMGINDSGDNREYKDIEEKTSFFNSLRTYKLLKLLWLHKKTIEIDLKDNKPSIELGQQYVKEGEYDRAEEIFKKVIGMEPNNDAAYVELGWCYREEVQYSKAKEILKKAIEINPKNKKAYVELALCYWSEQDYDSPKEILDKAIEITPDNDGAYVGLGMWYLEYKQYGNAEEMLRKAIEINPQNGWAYFQLGIRYRNDGEYDRAEEMFKKAVEMMPESDWAYIEFGRCYWMQGDYDKAEEILKKAIEIHPEDDKLYAILRDWYEEQGKYEYAEEYSKKVNRLRREGYNPVTRHNYQRLKEILTKRGVKLVCVQYPVRSVEPLKKMFKDEENVIFVDNERVFKEALKGSSYDEYFSDIFGGDFGHCTRKGNRLLAGNIANVILKECFKSSQASAEELKEIVSIKVFPDVLVNEYFYGFGAETLPWLWSKENKEVGVDDEDVILNLRRIRDMQMPLTRIFVPWEVWNPSVDYKTFTWDSDEMRSLYNVLDLYQEIGTKVILVTVDWLKDSPWRDTEGSSRAVLGLLEYLLKDKGYSCIQFWTLTNEPELTYGWLKKMPFENYVEIHQLVKKGLEEKGLSVKIIASDEVESSEWFEKSVQSLLKTADVFSSHAYFYPQDIDLISDFFKKRLGMVKNTPFFLSEFGFRGSDFGTCTNDLIDDYEYGVYVSDLCVEALNSGVDAASLWCLHQIRLLDEIEPEGGRMMRIGLWAFKDENWRPFPIFYIYRLFTRYIKSGSKVLKIEMVPSNILKAACVEYRGRYSLIIVNMTDEKQSFLINGIEPGIEFKKYLYSSSEISSAQKGRLKGEIPPESVLFYTNLL